MAAFSTFSVPVTLVRAELAGGHLLQRGGVEHQLGLHHRLMQAVVVAHVADDEAQARVGQGVAQVVLLLLVPAEDTDLGGAFPERPAHHGLAEGARAAGDQERLACKHPAGLRGPAA